jgi:hypothetical protein
LAAPQPGALITFGEGSTEAGSFLFKFFHACLELKHPADGSKRHALADQFHDVLHDSDLIARVAALAARGPGRLHDPELVKPPQERLLDLQQLGDLPDREQGQVLVIKWQ